MDRIYHSYDKWEDFKFGFYDNVSGKNKEHLIEKVLEMFNDKTITETYMERVILEWKYSCEHNLTNLSLNRIAYIGQAACCIYAGVPNSITMEAWSMLDKRIQKISDSIANATLNKWINSQLNNKQLCLKLD